MHVKEMSLGLLEGCAQTHSPPLLIDGTNFDSTCLHRVIVLVLLISPVHASRLMLADNLVAVGQVDGLSPDAHASRLMLADNLVAVGQVDGLSPDALLVRMHTTASGQDSKTS